MTATKEEINSLCWNRGHVLSALSIEEMQRKRDFGFVIKRCLRCDVNVIV